MIQGFLLSNFLFYILLIRVGGILLVRKNRTQQIVSPNAISVVIPFRNEKKRIIPLLDAIQLLEAHPLEYIFVDDHSDDGTAELLLSIGELSGNYKIITLGNGVFGKKEAIKAGVEEAKGEFILTWDADIVIPSGYFDKMLVPRVDMVVLPVRFECKNWWQSFLHLDVYLANALNIGVAGWKRPIMCSGANLLFKKAAFMAIDSDRTDYNVSGGDDLFLLNKMIENDNTIAVSLNEKLCVTTPGLDRYNEFLQQRNRWISKTSRVGDMFAIWTGLLVWAAWFMYICILCMYINAGQWILVILCFWFRIFFLWVANYSYFRMLKEHKTLLLLPFYDLYIPIQTILMLIYRVFYGMQWKGRKVRLNR